MPTAFSILLNYLTILSYYFTLLFYHIIFWYYLIILFHRTIFSILFLSCYCIVILYSTILFHHGILSEYFMITFFMLFLLYSTILPYHFVVPFSPNYFSGMIFVILFLLHYLYYSLLYLFVMFHCPPHSKHTAQDTTTFSLFLYWSFISNRSQCASPLHLKTTRRYLWPVLLRNFPPCCLIVRSKIYWSVWEPRFNLRAIQ